jgi:hypothetical protein
MIICHSHRFVFIHIHKTGGTSIERALDPHLAWNDLILGGSKFGEQIQGPYTKKYGLSKHSSVSDIEKICGRALVENYYVFSLVRHPLSRLCSMYNFVATSLEKWCVEQKVELRDAARHITPQAAKKKPALKWASTKAFLDSRDFSEFLRHGELVHAPGFRPQISSLFGGDGKSVKAQFFRLEDCPSWLGLLHQKLGIDFEFPKANESQLRLVDEKAVADEDRDYIESAFRQDYDRFDYDRKPPRRSIDDGIVAPD